MEPNADVHAMGRRALAEVGGVLDAVSAGDVEAMCREIRVARRIACYGVGREGLMMKALCMRLMHLGLDAHMVGDMTTPPVGEGPFVFFLQPLFLHGVGAAAHAILALAVAGHLLFRRCGPSGATKDGEVRLERSLRELAIRVPMGRAALKVVGFAK